MRSARIVENDTSPAARRKGGDQAIGWIELDQSLAAGLARQHDYGLLNLLARIDAPEPLLRHPAIEAGPEDAAPRSGAGLHRAEHAGLQPGDHLGAYVRLRLQRDKRVLFLRLHQRGAAA